MEDFIVEINNSTSLEKAKRVLVCGSRDYTDENKIAGVMLNLSIGTTIIEGGAKGADTIARSFAVRWGLDFEEYPANWKKYGKAAGPIRNKQMLIEGKPDLVLAFYSAKKKSKGTKNMVEQAEKAGVKTFEYF